MFTDEIAAVFIQSLRRNSILAGAANLGAFGGLPRISPPIQMLGSGRSRTFLIVLEALFIARFKASLICPKELVRKFLFRGH